MASSYEIALDEKEQCEAKKVDMPTCQEEKCLLFNTPAVGIFPMEARLMQDSLLGRTENGTVFKMGNGKFTKGNVRAARDLLEREFPQV